jgi:queuine/archaeosine tRNA-ribosyltransferase
MREIRGAIEAGRFEAYAAEFHALQARGQARID